MIFKKRLSDEIGQACASSSGEPRNGRSGAICASSRMPASSTNGIQLEFSATSVLYRKRSKSPQRKIPGHCPLEPRESSGSASKHADQMSELSLRSPLPARTQFLRVRASRRARSARLRKAGERGLYDHGPIVRRPVPHAGHQFPPRMPPRAWVEALGPAGRVRLPVPRNGEAPPRISGHDSSGRSRSSPRTRQARRLPRNSSRRRRRTEKPRRADQIEKRRAHQRPAQNALSSLRCHRPTEPRRLHGKVVEPRTQMPVDPHSPSAPLTRSKRIKRCWTRLAPAGRETASTLPGRQGVRCWVVIK